MLHQSLLVWNEYKQKNTIDSAHHQKVGKQWKHDTTCFNLYLFLSYIAKKNYPCLKLEFVFFFFSFFFFFFFFFFCFQFYQQKATFLLFHFVRVKTLWLSPIAFITKSQNTIIKYYCWNMFPTVFSLSARQWEFCPNRSCVHQFISL